MGAAMTEEFAQALERTAKANEAMYAGDPEPYIALFTQHDPVSLFGAWGPCKTAWPDIERTLRWVGSRFSGGTMTTENVVVHSGGDVACTVGYEHGRVAIDGGEHRDVRLRVTHIYRLENERWRLAHRHGDWAPVDQSPTA
jgi:ketosteroid isomerase-like protein